ncbi:MAG: CRISPR-associated endonuclease Cas1 [Nitrospirae bacterium RIFCSPHIGHO2_02_FULL_42_12]|nr:MAG: CRISPR-associated endonuclease Cas1 [Nitrospirae bacterium RIFCSPHIGHO2_02_FULL_42_12]
MQLVINTYGSYLQKNGDCFKIKKGDEVFEVSVKKVSSIMITTAAYITTDAIKLAMDHNIDIIFLDEFGDPFGRVWHSKLGSTTLIRRRQLEIAGMEEGLRLALSWVARKFDNQVELLKRLRNTRTQKSAEITSYIGKLENCRQTLDTLTGTIEERRGTIMGIEGSGGRIYFECLSFLMPDRYQFEGRSRNPARDEFNALLNYAYGVLYSRVEKACIIAGLDPYVGIIHTDNYNKKSLVFDLIENFRIWADETVVNLFAGRKVKQELFDELKNGFTLNKEGKAMLIEAFTKFLDESIRYNGRNIKRGDVIQFECHKIANGLIKEAEIGK